ncbi:MAG: DUF4012 domain-containing protein [Candidatus Kerfeldbacteria bacterium]|nr:DUF4012 domain-containing protein [Candidatus Kerfeldbacteria bacterium]
MAEHQPPIPPNNVLDLRQLVAERQAVKQRRRWSPPERFSRPDRPGRQRRIDWRVFSREGGKFFVAAVGVALLVTALTESIRVTHAIGRTTDLTKQAITQISTGVSLLGQTKLAESKAAFTAADSSLQGAETALRSTGIPAGLIEKIPVAGRRYNEATEVLALGRRLSRSGAMLTDLLPAETVAQPAISISSDGIIQGSVGVLSMLLKQRDQTEALLTTAIQALQQVASLRAHDLPSQYRERFEIWQRIIRDLGGSDQHLDSLAKLIFNLLAPASPQEYLVIFQNNDELRATGGFAGTFLLVKFEQGTFKILDAPGNGPYALADQIPHTNLPPQPLLALNPYWAFQDTNWFPDVPTSATFMLDFYNQARGFKPDGVIFITPQLVEDLLRVTGPLRPEKYNVDITADNFVRATEQQVQFGYDKAANNPKQFLIDLVPTLLQKLASLPGPSALQALAVALRDADQGALQMYSRDQAMQSAITDVNWDGALTATNGDYLAVIDANIGGGKTDRVIEERVSVNVTVDQNLLRHEVSVTRHHNGTVNDPLTGATNTDYLRIYAPSNAQFVSISGATPSSQITFHSPAADRILSDQLAAAEGQTLIDPQQGYRLTHENNKAVFGAWSRIDPSKEQTIVFRYTTPLPTGKQEKTWNFTWQHQAGAPVRMWKVVFDAGGAGKIVSAAADATVKQQGHRATFSTTSAQSRSFGVIFR